MYLQKRRDLLKSFIVSDTKWSPELTGDGPRYRLLADEIAAAIADGRLAIGERLPPVRELAWTLKVTPGTVARAYQLAEGRGLLRGEVGRGTFVSGPADPAGATSPPPVQGRAEDDAPDCALRERIDLRFNNAPDVGQEPALTEALLRVTRRVGTLPLTATNRYGEDELERGAARDWLESQGLRPVLEDLILTSGAQPALLSAMLAVAGGVDAVVATEPLMYPGLKDLARAVNIRLEPVEADEHGLVPESLDAACARRRPSAVVITPNAHNPTLTSLSEARRAAIVEVCRRRGLAIIEDDIYGPLHADAPPSFQVLAPERAWHIVSLSKSVAAGLRVGFLLTPPGEGPRTARLMQACAQHVPWLTSALTAELFRSGDADQIIQQVRAEVRRRVTLIRRIFREVGAGPEVLRTSDDASIAYLKLPEPWRASDYADAVAAEGALVRPAEMFVVGRAPAPHAVRLGFGQPGTAEIVAEGARRCAAVLSRGPRPTDAPA